MDIELHRIGQPADRISQIPDEIVDPIILLVGIRIAPSFLVPPAFGVDSARPLAAMPIARLPGGQRAIAAA